MATTVVAALAVFGPGLAGAESTATTAGPAETIFIREVNGALRFVGPRTLTQGEELRIVNATDAKEVGPHTFSLVDPATLPRTVRARRACFAPNHICKAIAGWHGVRGNGPPAVNPVEAGAEGWDAEGSLGKRGDSWFTGGKPRASFEQVVSVDASAGPRTIHFVCAIHPWMQGSVQVIAPVATTDG